jgi:hypothetical protein
MVNKKVFFRRFLAQRLRKIFHETSQRLCVSVGIKEVLMRRYGKTQCKVLYPIPGEGCGKKSKTPKKLKPLRIGYFGELGGNFENLECLAKVLASCQSTLTFFSHGQSNRRLELSKKKGVLDGGSLSERGLLKFFKNHIDVIVIAQGFDKENALLRKTCFPSKISEACRFGLPMLVIAPKYGSSHLWAKNNLPAKCIISKLEPQMIASSIKYLQNRNNWANAQSRVLIASKEFKPSTLHKKLEEALFESLPHEFPSSH